MVLLSLHFLSFIALALSTARHRELGGRLSVLCFCLILFLASFNYNVGMDYFAYKEIYLGVLPLIEIDSIGQLFYSFRYVHGEYGFLFINSLLRSFFESHNVVFFVLSSIALFLLFFVFNRFSRGVSFATFLYISFYLVNFHFVQIRLGVSASIVLYSLLYLLPKGVFFYVVGVLVAALFHKLAFFAIPLFVLVAVNFKVVLAVSLLFAPIVYFMNPIDLILDFVWWGDSYALQQLEVYAAKDKYQENAFPWIPFFVRLSIFVFLVFGYINAKREDRLTEWLLVFVSCGFFFWIVFWDLSILASRLNAMFFLGFCVLVPRLLSLIQVRDISICCGVAIVLYGFLGFYNLVLDPRFGLWSYQGIFL